MTTQNYARKIQETDQEESPIGRTLIALREALSAYAPQHENDDRHADHALTAKEIWACNRATD